MKKRFFMHLIVSLALLISSFVYLSYAEGVNRTPIRKKLALLPYDFGEWQGSDEAITDSKLQMLGVDDYIIRRYSNGQQPDIWVYVGYFESQTEGDTIHSPKNYMAISGWTPIYSSREKIHLTSGPIKIVQVNKYLVQTGVEKDLIVYWYHSRGRVVADDYLDRLDLVWDSIFKERSDSALIRLYCSAGHDEISAWRHLESFVREFFPILQEHLPDA